MGKNPKPKTSKPKFQLIPEEDWCDGCHDRKACWLAGSRRVCDRCRFNLEHRSKGGSSVTPST